MVGEQHHRQSRQDVGYLAEQAGGGVAGLLTATAAQSPAAAGLVTGESAMSWAEVDGAVGAKAAELWDAGLRPGGRVVTNVPTSAELVVSLLAILRAGGVAVPLTSRLDERSVAALVEHSGAGWLIAGDPPGAELARRVELVTPRIPRQPGPGAHEWNHRGGEDTALLAYVAGVDSPPRAAMYSHRALLANTGQLRGLLPGAAAGRARVLLAAPLTHLYSLVAGLLAPLSAGWSVLLPEAGSRTDRADSLLSASRAGRATTIVGTPAVYSELARVDRERLDEPLATVGTLLCGPSPVQPWVWSAVRRATGLNLSYCYGRAEVAGVVTSTLGSPRTRHDAVGVPLPGTELDLVDTGGEQGAESGDAADVFSDEETDTGVVTVRGPALSSGYWPDGAHGPDPDGWMSTGDVGHADETGQLHLVDRASDLIVVRGFNVYPREVEDVLAELPGVAEVAVLGVPDTDGADSVRAVVVPVTGAALTEESVREHCVASLPAYKVPATVRFADELPHTPTGLLRRNRMR